MGKREDQKSLPGLHGRWARWSGGYCRVDVYLTLHYSTKKDKTRAEKTKRKQELAPPHSRMYLLLPCMTLRERPRCCIHHSRWLAGCWPGAGSVCRAERALRVDPSSSVQDDEDLRSMGRWLRWVKHGFGNAPCYSTQRTFSLTEQGVMRRKLGSVRVHHAPLAWYLGLVSGRLSAFASVRS